MKNTIIFFFLFSFSFLHAKQITVCNSCSIKTIKQAVLQAENGDEILLKKGIYKENNIVINKSITLTGEKVLLLMEKILEEL